MNEQIAKEMHEMNDRMKGMDYEDMTEFERKYAEMKDIEWALMDMHSVIEGGEAREDYETTLASHHFREIDDYIRHRLSRVQSELKWHIQRKHLTSLLTGDEE